MPTQGCVTPAIPAVALAVPTTLPDSRPSGSAAAVTRIAEFETQVAALQWTVDTTARELASQREANARLEAVVQRLQDDLAEAHAERIGWMEDCEAAELHIAMLQRRHGGAK